MRRALETKIWGYLIGFCLVIAVACTRTAYTPVHVMNSSAYDCMTVCAGDRGSWHRSPCNHHCGVQWESHPGRTCSGIRQRRAFVVVEDCVQQIRHACTLTHCTSPSGKMDISCTRSCQVRDDIRAACESREDDLLADFVCVDEHNPRPPPPRWLSVLFDIASGFSFLTGQLGELPGSM